MEDFLHYLYVFFCSMVPIIELRGAIPIGAALGMPWWINFLICILGNMLPVPFILLFIRHILAWMKTTKHFAKIALWLEEKAAQKSVKVMRYASFGLTVFVLSLILKIQEKQLLRMTFGDNGLKLRMMELLSFMMMR